MNAGEWLRPGLPGISYVLFDIHDVKNRSVYPLIALSRIQGLVLVASDASEWSGKRKNNFILVKIGATKGLFDQKAEYRISSVGVL